MKLTRKKILETLRMKNAGETTYQARKVAGISIRRVNQVWSEYLRKGMIPEIGKKNGRPPKPVEDWEVPVVLVKSGFDPNLGAAYPQVTEFKINKPSYFIDILVGSKESHLKRFLARSTLDTSLKRVNANRLFVEYIDETHDPEKHGLFIHSF